MGDKEREQHQQTIALAATVLDEATGIANTLRNHLPPADARDLMVHANRARALYDRVCRSSGAPPLMGAFLQRELTLTELAVLTSAEFPLGGDYTAEAKLLGDGEDGRALVVHVEIRSKHERFRAAWFSSDYEEIKGVVAEVTRMVDAGASLGTFEPKYISLVGHLAMCVHNMGWRIKVSNKSALEA